MKRKGMRKGRVGAAVKPRREKAGVRGGGTTLGRLSRRDEGRTFEVSSGRFFQPPERVAQYQAAPRLTNGRPPAPTIPTSWPATRLDENFPRDTLSGKDTHGPNPRDPLTNRRGEIMYRVARSISVHTWMCIYSCIFVTVEFERTISSGKEICDQGLQWICNFEFHTDYSIDHPLYGVVFEIAWNGCCNWF